MAQKTYEAMFILIPKMDDEEIENAVNLIKEEIVKLNGEIVNVKKIGRQNLAYPIKKYKEGYYFLLYFKSDTDDMEKLKTRYKINEKIVRYIIVTMKEKDIVKMVNTKEEA